MNVLPNIGSQKYPLPPRSEKSQAALKRKDQSYVSVSYFAASFVPEGTLKIIFFITEITNASVQAHWL